ncbi:GNAT family N-acetyltransferase [Pseudodesulfovibrio sediminis]|uniref:N-acetyltransferase n=1 Tax=Pseudodesulfovibrio sediminis TaxID=2810563 RepID=A0ABM7PAE9_9BACT|nr:GNAT family protein [Pseudodesulfovibrio sediminis]BCS90086.1 N-acetyltransferase [Pseudodesulfovibrio sediminis]
MIDFSDVSIHTKRCILRPWRTSDARILPSIANTKKISWNTSNKFPYPYDETSANTFLTFQTHGLGKDTWQFAITLDEALIGGCGCIRGKDVQTHTAIVGYWLGVEYWGKGLATEVVQALVEYMTHETDVKKLTATVFGWNPASRRVLEKCGFDLEGVSKDAVHKWGKTTDLWYLARSLP